MHMAANNLGAAAGGRGKSFLYLRVMDAELGQWPSGKGVGVFAVTDVWVEAHRDFSGTCIGQAL